MGILKTLTINGVQYAITPVVPADSVTLLASAWESDGDAHSQVVEVPGVTAHTKIDLQPTAEQLVEFHYKVLAFVAENDNGVVTVYSIGDKPACDHTIQITKTEVEGTGLIRGNTVGTTMPRPDWNQKDPRKADYIHNKPDDIVCDESGSVINVSDASKRKMQGLTLYGKTTQNGSPTPDAPVDLVSAGDGGSIGVSVCGKNLIDADAMQNSYFTKDANGVYHLSSAMVGAVWNFPNPIPPNTPIHFKFYDLAGYNANSDALFYITKIFTDGTSAGGDWLGVRGSFTNEITILRDKALRAITIYPYNPSADYYCNFSAVQAEIGRTATEYEPYKGQTLTVSTPNGLPGVPVTNGGNYTDASGQRWVSDEIDFAKGVYVKRIGKIASYAGETIPGAYMSTTGELSDGAAVLYALLAAIETALDTDTLESYAALHSNKPNTTVYTDCNAGVKFEYIADTKAYIDNKFAELAAAIVANT